MPRPDAKIQRDLRKRFAVSFKNIRLQREMSMHQFAKKLDVSVPMIMKYERAQSLPSLETLVEISRKLMVTIDDLMGNTSSGRRSNPTKK